MKFGKISFVLMIVLAGVLSGFGQNGDALPVFNKTDGGFPSLRKLAQEITNATVKGDYEKLADLTHPEVVKLAGGRKKMIDGMKLESAQIKAEGFELISIATGDVKQIARVENEIFAVVMIEMVINSSNTKSRGGSSLIGISSDNGATWKFVNGVDQVRLKQMFPKAAEKIVVPPDTEPEPIKSE